MPSPRVSTIAPAEVIAAAELERRRLIALAKLYMMDRHPATGVRLAERVIALAERLSVTPPRSAA